MVSQGSANSQILEPNNLVFILEAFALPPKFLVLRIYGGEKLGACIPPMCLGYGQERLVYLFPFWEFCQQLPEGPLQKREVPWAGSLTTRLAAAPPAGHFVAGLVLGEEN